MWSFVLSPNVAIGNAKPSAHRVTSMINSLLGVMSVMVVSERTDRDYAGARASATHLSFNWVVSSTFLALVLGMGKFG